MTPFAMPVNAAATVPAAPGTPARPLDVVDRAWIASEKPDQSSFSRRHPLTIEGEQIGAFELTFLCAPDGAVAVAYNESRHLREGTNDRLSALAIGSGKEHVLLNVQSSAPDLAGSELLSAARNAVPPALLNALAETEGRSLVVATQTLANTRTTIRPGNAGFAENLRRTIAACKK